MNSDNDPQAPCGYRGDPLCFPPDCGGACPPGNDLRPERPITPDACEQQVKKAVAAYLEELPRHIVRDAYGYGDTPTQLRAVDSAMWDAVDDPTVHIPEFCAVWLEPLKPLHPVAYEAAYRTPLPMLQAVAAEWHKLVG